MLLYTLFSLRAANKNYIGAAKWLVVEFSHQSIKPASGGFKPGGIINISGAQIAPFVALAKHYAQ
ncbi:hypothetical protein [Aeromonas caviae]|uniref:Uncharacterized protein n=1 Tax=Aeromonas caviae TaxID=648 RepID=A0AAJ5ZC24_AERCA|nr:hypothetical protein [Aeromonas caviae]WFF99671.1 hypothetical protein P5S46_08875 [Aeromonas caviae]